MFFLVNRMIDGEMRMVIEMRAAIWSGDMIHLGCENIKLWKLSFWSPLDQYYGWSIRKESRPFPKIRRIDGRKIPSPGHRNIREIPFLGHIWILRDTCFGQLNRYPARMVLVTFGWPCKIWKSKTIKTNSPLELLLITWMSRWKLGSKVRISGLYSQYIPIISRWNNPFPNHLLTSWDIQVEIPTKIMFLFQKTIEIHGLFKRTPRVYLFRKYQLVLR